MTRCIECQTRAVADALHTEAPTVATLQRALQMAATRIARLSIEAAERDPLLRAAIERNRELEDICSRLNARLAQGRRPQPSRPDPSLTERTPK